MIKPSIPHRLALLAFNSSPGGIAALWSLYESRICVSLGLLPRRRGLRSRVRLQAPSPVACVVKIRPSRAPVKHQPNALRNNGGMRHACARSAPMPVCGGVRSRVRLRAHSLIAHMAEICPLRASPRRRRHPDARRHHQDALYHNVHARRAALDGTPALAHPYRTCGGNRLVTRPTRRRRRPDLRAAPPQHSAQQCDMRTELRARAHLRTTATLCTSMRTRTELRAWAYLRAPTHIVHVVETRRDGVGGEVHFVFWCGLCMPGTCPMRARAGPVAWPNEAVVPSRRAAAPQHSVQQRACGAAPAVPPGCIPIAYAAEFAPEAPSLDVYTVPVITSLHVPFMAKEFFGSEKNFRLQLGPGGLLEDQNHSGAF
ncbi:hypothetical protein GGX14DRAFT_405959 [Mycena pura]|uniref:Uncharacterized protein n=1 Tax=Mycena pura TaxID=153505 RepID=A0AAD6UR99_9AGAR|nr:hypothetical protein GGX14DRAFT_405959 [Mycena pura]